MRRRNHSLLCCWTLALALGMSIGADAQTDSVARREVSVERVSMLGIGYTDILDTYLSQEKFTGTELRYVSRSLRQRCGQPLVREMSHQVYVTSAGTRGNSRSLLSAMYRFGIGWYYEKKLAGGRLAYAVGGQASGILGGVYNTRNSNNPAQARLALSVDPAVKLRWNIKLGRMPLTLRYNAAMPLAEIAFSPNYGQSYYEIFSQGNYDHNIVVNTPFAAPQLQQTLTVDFRLWRQTFTIGYLGDIRQMRANNLKYHQYTHAILIGWQY